LLKALKRTHLYDSSKSVAGGRQLQSKLITCGCLVQRLDRCSTVTSAAAAAAAAVHLQHFLAAAACGSQLHIIQTHTTCSSTA
jgi:hypothetical protein